MAKLNEAKFNEFKKAEDAPPVSPPDNPPKVESPPKMDSTPKDKVDQKVKGIRATLYPMQTPQGVSIGSKPVDLPITSWIQCQIDAKLLEIVG